MGCLAKRPAMQFTKITGGITNILVKATPASQHGLEPVAVKVFGAKTDMLIDRDMETAVAQGLAGHGFGPKVAGYAVVQATRGDPPMRGLSSS